MSSWVPTRLIILLNLVFCLRPAMAQGTMEVLNTGNGQTLVTQVRPVLVDASAVQPELRFNFGFGTDEIVAPGTFLDSFTVTIQNSNQLFTAVCLTADASGTVLAPPTPGTLPIDFATIAIRGLTYPNLQPDLANRQAYQVTALIPSQFVGGPINVYFDLFDNLDTKASQGWFSDLEVVSVPEPQTWTLLLLGLGLCLSARRFRT